MLCHGPWPSVLRWGQSRPTSSHPDAQAVRQGLHAPPRPFHARYPSAALRVGHSCPSAAPGRPLHLQQQRQRQHGCVNLRVSEASRQDLVICHSASDDSSSESVQVAANDGAHGSSSSLDTAGDQPVDGASPMFNSSSSNGSTISSSSISSSSASSNGSSSSQSLSGSSTNGVNGLEPARGEVMSLASTTPLVDALLAASSNGILAADDAHASSNGSAAAGDASPVTVFISESSVASVSSIPPAADSSGTAAGDAGGATASTVPLVGAVLPADIVSHVSSMPTAAAEGSSSADVTAEPSTAPAATAASGASTASSPSDPSSSDAPNGPLHQFHVMRHYVGLQLQAFAAWVAGLANAAKAAIGAFFATLAGFVPGWTTAQHVRRLREAAEEEPKDAEKQLALLAALNRQGASGACEVLQRVADPSHPSSPAIIVERMRALVISGKLPEYAAEDTVAVKDDHRSLAQLLRELHQQASGEQRDDAPGNSARRPLHIMLDNGSSSGIQKRAGPLQILWMLMVFAAGLVGLSFAWLVGSQAVRRSQAGPAVVTVVTPSGAAASASGAASGSGGGTSNQPSVDPKEYKKDELPEKSVRMFKDVKGCDEAKDELVEVVEFLKDPTKFTRLGAKLPKGVLLTGPPGTGKTLLARAVAGEAGVPFFYRSGSEFEELYVGVGSRRMRALFQAAKKKAPCIVFIDEIDAIGGNRKHWENHSRKTLNQLLVEMDGFEASDNVIVMAATNLPETLDPALTRPGRFDRQVVVPIPDIRGREEIISHYLDDKPVAGDIDRNILARQTQGFSGADIANLVNEAALLAAKQNTDVITGRQVDSAFDKILMGVERRSVRRTPEGLRHTAYHESGHALVALHTDGASPIHKATIMHRGSALGMVTQVGRDDEFSINRQQMQARILVALGGTVAEELVFGREGVTSGATSDLKVATSMARHMVMDCGLNDVVGPMHIHDEKTLSEDTRQKVDNEVRSMLCAAREAVRAMLVDKMQELHTLAAALIEHETLTLSEIKQVLDGTFTGPAPPVSSSRAPPVGNGPQEAEASGRDETELPEGAQVVSSVRSAASASSRADVRSDVLEHGPSIDGVSMHYLEQQLLPLLLPMHGVPAGDLGSDVG